MKIKLFRPAWLRSLGMLLAVCGLATAAQLAVADAEHAASWGPQVGTTAPLLEANDHDGKTQTLDTLRGPEGLLVVFNRSVDW